MDTIEIFDIENDFFKTRLESVPEGEENGTD